MLISSKLFGLLEKSLEKEKESIFKFYIISSSFISSSKTVKMFYNLQWFQFNDP
jgi:hypothetical protein